MKTYIISTDKGFKLLKELPEKIHYIIDDDGVERYQAAYQYAIDSAPFIKQDKFSENLLKWEFYEKAIKKNHPYQVDLSGYDVSEPYSYCINYCINGSCEKEECRFKCKEIALFVTLTPSDWWTIWKGDKAWLCIEGHQDDQKANEIARGLNSFEKSSATENSAQVESQEEFNDGVMKGTVNLKPLLCGMLQAQIQRILRDKGAMNKDVSDALEMAFYDCIKDFILTRKGEAKP